MVTAKTGSTQVDLLQSATRLSDKVQGALTKWSASLQAKATQPIAAAPVKVAEALPAQSRPKEMDASQSNAEATPKTEDDKPSTPFQKIIGCGGCLGLIILFFVLVGIFGSTRSGESGGSSAGSLDVDPGFRRQMENSGATEDAIQKAERFRRAVQEQMDEQRKNRK